MVLYNSLKVAEWMIIHGAILLKNTDFSFVDGFAKSPIVFEDIENNP